MTFRESQVIPGVEAFVKEEYTGKQREECLKLTKAMHSWIPILQIGNGDFICIDGGKATSPVIYDSHEDQGNNTNGCLLADKFESFMAGWANNCFQIPRDDWRCCTGKRGVKWSSSQFRAPKLK